MKILYDHQIFWSQEYGGPSRYFINLINKIINNYDYQIKVSSPLYINSYLRQLPKQVLSSCELQIIVIASAIYHDTEILILDEFTSSLDEKTESEIIKNIFSLDKTIIVATHRMATLKYCDKIYNLSNSELNEK